MPVNPEQLLHLSLLQNIQPTVTKQLVEFVLSDSVNLYDLREADYRNLGISEDVAKKIVDGFQDFAPLDAEYDLLEKNTGITWIPFGHADYPALLWHTFAPPPVLYVQGEPAWHEGPTLSVVGSRAGTSYGRRALETILTPCIEQGMVIVSGGALGIDTMAHELTLRHGGKTVVVLGSGLLRLYPPSNKKLFQQVVESGGAVISCFPLEAEPIPWRFPVRNRIIAGMSRGCLVAQAAQGSGALITAHLALHEGRNVYAVPGHFDDPLSAGCHSLLQEGAQLTVDAQGILADYPTAATPIIAQQPIVFEKKSPQKKVEVVEAGLAGLCIRPKSLDELKEETGKSENELKAELFDLQLAGKVEQDFSGLWLKI